MHRLILTVIFVYLTCQLIQANNDSLPKHFWLLESDFHFGYVVENARRVPKSTDPFLVTFNPSIQTNGSKDWHQIFGFPRVGCSFVFGDLGNHRKLGNLYGLMPNITFSITRNHWYSPKLTFGLGLAYFNRPYDSSMGDTANFYIGSHITALANATLYLQPQITRHISLKAGIAVFHASNCHYQIPNLGINIPSLFVGLIYTPAAIPRHFEKRNIQVPAAKWKFNIRIGFGVHELAKTLGPAGTPKYAIYLTDLYLSRRSGKVSNIHIGVEGKHYNSYYNEIIRSGVFTDKQKLRATVLTAFLAHELMIHRFSLLTQGGINVYNEFYNKHEYEWKKGLKDDFKKYISTKLGVQYYLFDPKYCTRNNIFIGTYIKAHFGQADFACIQLGCVL